MAQKKKIPKSKIHYFQPLNAFSNSTLLRCMGSSIKIYPKIVWENKPSVVGAFGNFAFETNVWQNDLLN